MCSHMSSAATGSSLIEVMIAMLLFGVALQGLGAAQLAAKFNLDIAQQRSIATLLGRDMAEKIQANHGQLAGYAQAIARTSPPETAPDCVASSCSAAELALYDVYEWKQLLAGPAQSDVGEGSLHYSGGLASPSACIEQDGQTVRVVLAWWGRRSLPNPAGSPCGEESGLYGPNNEHRRVIVLNAFIGGAWG
jgi:type IV pilus assembly protein PilV